MKFLNSRALRLALVYALVAIIWILFSDYMVSLLPAAFQDVAQSSKGVAFVIVTATTLFLLTERLTSQTQAESARTASAERMLTQVIETVPVAVLLTGDDGTITYINPHAAQMFGLRTHEAAGMSLDEVCCSGIGECSVRVGELLRTGSVDGLEVVDRSDPARRRAVAARAASIDPAVASSGRVIALADVTEAHLESVRIDRLLASYRFLAEALTACARMSDERELLRVVGRLAVEYGGYTGAWTAYRVAETAQYETVGLEGLGERSREVAELMRTHTETVPEAEQLQQLVSGGLMVSNDIVRDPANPWYPAAETEAIGSLVSFACARSSNEIVATVTLFAPEPGRFDSAELELVRSLRDSLSFAFEKARLDRQRMTAEEALELSERGYRELFQSIPAPMWVYDIETLAFLEVNDAAIAKYGYTSEQFKSMTIADIRPAEDVPRLIESVGMRTSFEDAGVWTHRDVTGRSFPVHIYAHRIVWEGREAELVMALEVATIE